ncbi:MAG: exopolysaccharide biosynthesis polyprenyl glycosylphosphotransferase [Pseudomonadota bacterium]
MDAVGETSLRDVQDAGWAEHEPEHHEPVARAPKRPLQALAALKFDTLVSDLFFLAEICLISLLGILAAYLWGDTALTIWTQLHPQAMLYMLVPAGAAALLQANGLYGFQRLAAFPSAFPRVMGYVGAAFGLALVADFGFHPGEPFSGFWLLAWLVTALIGLTALRGAAGWLCNRLIKGGAVQHSVAVIGSSDAAQAVIEALEQHIKFVELTGVFSGSSQLHSVLDSAREGAFDRIVIATDDPSSARTRHMLGELHHVPCAVQIALPLSAPLPGAQQPALALFDVQSAPISGWGLLAKRGVDIVLASAGLLILTPVLALAALAIKLDSSGPVLFTQRRHGLNRKIFKIFKLRSMSVMEDGARAVQASRKDARVTRVGAFLRKTSIDELPQLLNVLRGDMSLVGPRPHPLSLDDQYAGELEIYSSRHKVKPGITGWAQIHGHRGPTDKPGLMQSRVQHDLEYINNWSLWLDLKIIAATPFLGVMHRNAV